MQDQYLLDSENNKKAQLSGKFCGTCETSFKDTEAHKSHYKTEFHAYNLKRKLVDLPPVKESIFEQSLQKFKEAKLKQATVRQQQHNKCDVCNKNFKSPETLEQHLQSKKHQQNLQKEKIIKPFKELSLDETALVKDNVCLFCNDQFENFDETMMHMHTQHSFFILEDENCINKKAILKILSRQIFEKKECIFCSHIKQKEFKKFQDVQKHMIQQGHCMMNPDFIQDFKKYYDYSKENQEIIEKYIINGKYTMEDLKAFETIEVARQGEQVDDEDEWMSIDEEEFEDIVSEPDNMPTEGNKYYDLRNFVLFHSKALPSGELQLPNNKIIGHKKYDMYYKQQARPQITEEKMIKYLEDKKDLVDNSQALQLYNYGELSNLYFKTRKLEKVREKKQMVKERNEEDKLKFRFIKRNLKDRMNTNMRHNKVLTQHYREQNMQ